MGYLTDERTNSLAMNMQSLLQIALGSQSSNLAHKDFIF